MEPLDQTIPGDRSDSPAPPQFQVPDAWTQGSPSADGSLCVHQVFDRQVDLSPDAVAIVCRDIRLTYRQLNDAATRVAGHLIRAGAGPDVLIGLTIERSPEQIIALLGILKAGGAYFPLDPHLPASRLRFLIDDARPAIILTRRSRESEIPPTAAQILCIESLIEPASTAVDGPAVQPVHPLNLAYVIYTSGSTGEPKGVEIPHRGITRLVCGADYAVLNSDLRVAVLAPLSFDASTFEIWGPLLNGGCCVLLPEGVPDLLELEQELQRHRVQTIWLTASLFNSIIDERPETLRGISQLLTGGEALSARHVERAVRVLGAGTRLINGYGPTESTTFTCCHPIPHDFSSAGGSVPIGRPISGTEVHVLDDRLQPVAVGVPGELYIAGAGLARGYLNRPQLTAERFVSNPFGQDPGDRMYRTGDRVCWRPDGTLDFLGRFDDQIKLRGFRIELGEIETVLSRQPGIRQAAVILAGDEASARRLIAYYTPAPDALPTADELTRRLHALLPEYMIPAQFVQLDTMPLTPNGKLDRRALPDPARDWSAHHQNQVAPRSPAEELLASIWCAVLGIDRVGVHDHFLDLGGHSLDATRISSRIRESFGIVLPARSVLEFPTIAELAARITAGRSSEAAPAPQPPRAAQDFECATLSFAQRRLWFLEQLEGDLTAYNLAFAVRLDGPLNVEALRSALEEVVRRHEPLHSVFEQLDGEPAVRFCPPERFELRWVDLTGRPDSQRENDWQTHVQEEADRPFDLRRDLLLRATLAQLEPGQQRLLLTVHHIAADGWSVSILWKELGQLYAARLQHQPLPLFNLPLRYSDFTTWQRQQLAEPRLSVLVDYWRRQLADLSPLDLPADRARPLDPTYRGAAKTFEIPAQVVRQLVDLARAERTTLHMLLLAAFQTLVGRYSGQTDFAIGTPFAGRSRVELEPLIGFFVNTLPLRADLAGDPTFRELLQRVRGVSLGADEHQELPFEKLVEVLKPERDRARAPFFQVVFQHMDFPEATLELPGVRSTPEFVAGRRVRFDLEMQLAKAGSGIHGVVSYSTDLFDGDRISRLIGHYTTLLAGIVANPICRISRLPLMSPEEVDQVLVAFNQTTLSYPDDRCVHELFDEQVARAPDAVALISNDSCVTYAQLHSAALRLAEQLEAQGVVAEMTVGVCLDRSVTQIAALLAILKTGAAYLPLDPQLPTARLALLTADARAQVILTQQAHREKFAASGQKVVCLDADSVQPPPANNARLPQHVRPENLAYIMYTSGSTGTPKGVEIPHRGITRLVRGAGCLEFQPQHRVAHLAPLAFDASTLEIWAPLLNGGCCVLLPEGVPDLTVLGQQLRRHRVDTLWLTATLFNSIIDERPETLDGVARIFTGGEALSVTHVQRALFALGPDTTLINGYGPTENTTFTCCHPIPRDLAADAMSVPIGRPIANTRVYVLDQSLQPVPVGVPGELYLGGAGLARGYLRRPDLTAERFVANPLPAIEADRLYRTGDRVTFRADGTLLFLERLDDQIKLRGFRIELGEIETALAQLPEIRQAAVCLLQDSSGFKRLVAFCVGQPELTITPAELAARLRMTLPLYMVPSEFVPLEELPRTANGKLDRQALARCALTGNGGHDHDSEPRNANERELARIWAETLGRPRVGIHTNFFDLGGHSLLAMKLVARIEQRFHRRIPVATLFRQGSVAQTALLLSQQDADRDVTIIPIQPGLDGRRALFVLPSMGGFPSVSHQLLQSLDPEVPVYFLQPGLSDRAVANFSDVATTARLFVQSVREFQPQGPYSFLGYSFGGMLAYEVARQLQELGHPIDLLAVIDASPGGALSAAHAGYDLGRLLRIVSNLPHWIWHDLLTETPRSLWSRTRRSFRRWSRRGTGWLTGNRPQPEIDEEFEPTEVPTQSQILRAKMFQLFHTFQPAPSSLSITLFRATVQSLLATESADLGWRQTALGGVEIVPIAGHHRSIIRGPGVRLLAEELNRRLKRLHSTLPSNRPADGR